MKYRDLETVRQIIKEATDLEVMYAYDDLVFPDHGVFMIQYDDKMVNKLKCYFFKDCEKEEQDSILTSLKKAGKEKKYDIHFEGLYHFEQKGEEIAIHYI